VPFGERKVSTAMEKLSEGISHAVERVPALRLAAALVFATRCGSAVPLPVQILTVDRLM
jgi:hypothetical protein